MTTILTALESPKVILDVINNILQKSELQPYIKSSECSSELKVKLDWSNAPKWAVDVRFSDFASGYFIWTDGKNQWSKTIGFEGEVATDINNLLIVDTKPLKETSMNASNNVYVKALSKELATAGIEHTGCQSKDNQISIKSKTPEGDQILVTVATEFSLNDQENYTVNIINSGENTLKGGFSATTTTVQHIIGLLNKN